MTENEALKILNNECEDISKVQIALKVAREALEEIQQYRAIGTVEGYEKAIQATTGYYLLMKEYKSKVQDFEAIGTVDEFKALKEKNTPYKPQEYEDKYYGCKCGEVLLEKWEVYPTKMMPKSWGLPYCMGCGQKLDWQ